MDNLATRYDELGLILRYLKGELPEHEKLAFEARLKKDPLFALAVEQIVNSSPDDDAELVDQIRAQQQVMLETLERQRQGLSPSPVLSKRKTQRWRYLPYLSVAAAVLVLVALYVIPPKTPYGGPIAELLPEPYPDQLTTLSGTKQKLDEATALYRAQQYALAIPQYDSLLNVAEGQLSQRERIEARMNLASAHIQIQQFREAEKRLLEVQALQNPDYEVPLQWMLSWVYLRTDRLAEAQQALDRLLVVAAPDDPLRKQADQLGVRLQQARVKP